MRNGLVFAATFSCVWALTGPAGPASAGGAAALRVIASVEGPDVDVPASGAVEIVSFDGAFGPVSGFGISGQWIAVTADSGGGTAPWSTDFGVTVTAPASLQSTSPSPWFGEISIASYPLADGFGGFGATIPDGNWTVEFDSGNPSPWVAGLRDVTYHLLGPAVAVEYEYSDTTDQPTSWNRPFSIVGVSGLGPVSYHVLEFEVSESGLYEFESVLASGGDHWTCLYEGAFIDAFSLIGLVDYGLGNGFSPFGVPRGESRFSQLLFAGTRYFWVTSQWGSFSAPSMFSNTITGPGSVTVAGQGCNAADNAEPFGVLDLADVQGFIAAFSNQEPAADIATPLGVWDLADVQAFIGAFNAGCP